MAPDKIYLYREQPKDYFDEAWHELLASDVENIEYLRKEALLDWAKERKEQMIIEAAGCSNMLAAGEFLAYDKLIEQIESM